MWSDPGVKLFYNDYNIGEQNQKSDRVYKMLKGLKDRKIRVDGVGFQMHLNGDNGFDVNSLRASRLEC